MTRPLWVVTRTVAWRPVATPMVPRGPTLGLLALHTRRADPPADVSAPLPQESLLKCLFATETFAMGLNMPARTVVFTGMQKWDGEQHRFMGSGEYIQVSVRTPPPHKTDGGPAAALVDDWRPAALQMSGRAGRRGKDDRGLAIMMVDDKMEEEVCREVVAGRPSPLVSSFRLSYYTLLNIMRRMEGSGQDLEFVIRNSFQQYQHDQGLSKLQEQLKEVEAEQKVRVRRRCHSPVLCGPDRRPLPPFHRSLRPPSWASPRKSWMHTSLTGGTWERPRPGWSTRWCGPPGPFLSSSPGGWSGSRSPPATGAGASWSVSSAGAGSG